MACLWLLRIGVLFPGGRPAAVHFACSAWTPHVPLAVRLLLGCVIFRFVDDANLSPSRFLHAKLPYLAPEMDT